MKVRVVQVMSNPWMVFIQLTKCAWLLKLFSTLGKHCLLPPEEEIGWLASFILFIVQILNSQLTYSSYLHYSE